MLLVGRFVIRISRRNHHALDPNFHHLVEERAHAIRVGAIEKRRIRSNAEARVNGRPNTIEGELVSAFAAYRKIVMLFLSIHVNRKTQVLARLEQVQLFFQQQRVGAEVNIFLARDQAFDNLVDLRMHEWLAARYRNHRRSALIDSFEAVFGREIFF